MTKLKGNLPIIFTVWVLSLTAQPSPPTYVIVHGAWGGSWAFKEVDSLLTEKGAVVYRPCLTGQGERYHLASPYIGLETHILDVVNVLIFEELENVILVGHSYGGMVITGVADSVPERIRKVVYLDAFVPKDGESMMSISGDRGDWLESLVVDGMIIPPWVKDTDPYPKDVPHVLKTVTDPIRLSGRGQHLPSFYILTVDEGMTPGSDRFYPQAERARANGWPVEYLTADHNPQWSVPEELADFLYQLR